MTKRSSSTLMGCLRAVGSRRANTKLWRFFWGVGWSGMKRGTLRSCWIGLRPMLAWVHASPRAGRPCYGEDGGETPPRRVGGAPRGVAAIGLGTMGGGRGEELAVAGGEEAGHAGFEDDFAFDVDEFFVEVKADGFAE